MILSFTVILIECTNEISYGLPIMLTLMVSEIEVTHKCLASAQRHCTSLR